MTDFIVTKCYGCGTALPGEPGYYYCDACIRAQEAELIDMGYPPGHDPTCVLCETGEQPGHEH